MLEITLRPMRTICLYVFAVSMRPDRSMATLALKFGFFNPFDLCFRMII